MTRLSLIPGLVIALVAVTGIALVAVIELARIAYALAAMAGGCP